MKPFKLGTGKRVAWLRVGDRVAIEQLTASAGGWTSARTLRDAVAATIERIELTHIGRRRAYILYCRTDNGTHVVTRTFYGGNAIKTAIPRTAVRTGAPR